MNSKDPNEILQELSKLQRLRSYRLLFLVPLISLLAIFFVFWLGTFFFASVFGQVTDSFLFQALCFISSFLIPVLALSVWFLSQLIGSKMCPLCGNAFHAKIAYHWTMVGSTYSRKCLHCGLLLDGSNIEGSSNYAIKGTSA